MTALQLGELHRRECACIGTDAQQLPPWPNQHASVSRLGVHRRCAWCQAIGQTGGDEVFAHNLDT